MSWRLAAFSSTVQAHVLRSGKDATMPAAMARVDLPLAVLSDVHLNHEGSESRGTDLARLIRELPKSEIVLAGDVFDLSRDSPRACPKSSIVELFRLHSPLFSAVRSHLAGGGRMTMIAGNHDAAIAGPEVREALLSALELTEDAPLATEPWFVRRGGMHIEHGHLYDPDNAPAHPLAPWSCSTEPLGIALTRRFLAPTGALALAHAHETTPVGALVRAYELFGLKAPLVVARYFATAALLCAEAGRQPGLESERELGEEALAAFATQTGIPKESLAELLASRKAPTHHHFLDTFMRLYFDRVVATLSLAFGASSLLLKKSPAGAALFAVSGTYLGASVKRGKSRYSGVIEQRLREAASFVAEKTEAKLVIFGHTHREDRAPGYLNCGSFGYPSDAGARPYILCENGREPEPRYLPRSS